MGLYITVVAGKERHQYRMRDIKALKSCHRIAVQRAEASAQQFRQKRSEELLFSNLRNSPDFNL